MNESDYNLQHQDVYGMTLKELCDSDIVSECLTGNKEAWEEFFTRFDPVMRDAIVSTLIARPGRKKYVADDDDDVWEIYEKVVIKLYRDDLLLKCTDPTGVRYWLRTVAANTARDWFKSLGRQKNLPGQSEETGMRSIDTPLFDDSETTIGDTIQCESSVTLEDIEFAETLLQDIEGMADRRNYWIHRLSLFAIMPMIAEETDELARYNKMHLNAVQEKVAEIAVYVDEKLEERETDLGRAVLLYHQLRRLESMLHDVIDDENKYGAIKKLQDEIEAKSVRRAKILKKCQKLPRPSNGDIAQLVGIPKQQEDQISVILIRTHEQLKNKWKTKNQDDEDD